MDVVVTNNFVGFVDNLNSTRRIGFAFHSADGGVRQEVQVLRWTQADETDQLTVTDRRLEG